MGNRDHPDADKFHAISMGSQSQQQQGGGRRDLNRQGSRSRERGVHLDRSASEIRASLWERPPDEPLKSYLSRVKTKMVRSTVVQGSCGIVMLITSIISEDYLGWSDSYTSWATGARLLDLQYIYSVITVALALAGGYLWTRFWWQVNKDEDRLLRWLKVYILAFIISWGLAIWTIATVFVQFPDIPSEFQSESSDFHTYVMTDIIVLFFYLSVGLHYISSLFVNMHQLVEKKYIEGTILTLPQSSLNQTGLLDLRKKTNAFAPAIVDGGGDVSSGRSQMVNSRRFETPSAPPMGETGTIGIDSGGGFAYPSVFLDPRQFEALWEAQAIAGNFTTKVEHVPAREDIVNHLSEKGFQVVAAGVTAGEIKILFCARKASNRASDVVWFLAEFTINLSDSTLTCVMKSPDQSVLPVFVQSFALEQIMKPILSPGSFPV